MHLHKLECNKGQLSPNNCSSFVVVVDLYKNVELRS